MNKLKMIYDLVNARGIETGPTSQVTAPPSTTIISIPASETIIDAHEVD